MKMQPLCRRAAQIRVLLMLLLICKNFKSGDGQKTNKEVATDDTVAAEAAAVENAVVGDIAVVNDEWLTQAKAVVEAATSAETYFIKSKVGSSNKSSSLKTFTELSVEAFDYVTAATAATTKKEANYETTQKTKATAIQQYRQQQQQQQGHKKIKKHQRKNQKQHQKQKQQHYNSINKFLRTTADATAASVNKKDNGKYDLRQQEQEQQQQKQQQSSDWVKTNHQKHHHHHHRMPPLSLLSPSLKPATPPRPLCQPKYHQHQSKNTRRRKTKTTLTTATTTITAIMPAVVASLDYLNDEAAIAAAPPMPFNDEDEDDFKLMQPLSDEVDIDAELIEQQQWHKNHHQHKQHHHHKHHHLEHHHHQHELHKQLFQHQQQLSQPAAASSRPFGDDNENGNDDDADDNADIWSNENFDRYFNVADVATRSGRHRGRHIMLPPPSSSSSNQTHSILLPYAAQHQNHHSVGVGISTGKVFRSLPDNDEYNYEAHRMLTTQSQRHWPVKHEAIVEGDLILGGLMMVHSREDTIMCGPIMPQGGIQALEAMLYTIDRINERGLLPNITLGAHILDDCDKDSYGLEMAVDFIKGSISNIDDAEYHCNKTQVRKVISGVVGAASSVTSIQVANLLRLFRIPQVSFFSTSPELSNKQRFEYFSRTIPSDHYQVKAMVEIVKRMGWSYVSIIYEESNYGIKAFEELEELMARHNICIAIKEKLVKDSGVAEEIAYDNIVQKLLTKPRARGAIIFGSDQEVREVMRAVRRNNATGAFSWIGSDGWSARNLVSDGNEPEVEGTLSVQPQANSVKGFEEYFLNLTVENNRRNPWFVEFWEDHFQCRYPNTLSTPYNNYNKTCTTKERLSRQDTDFEDQLQFVSDAVMAFAYALRDMHRDLCGGKPKLCDAMKPTKGADLLKYLRKVQFQGLSGDHFRFDGNGDGPARYNIIHFKQSAEGQYHWVKVGEYYEGELRLNMSEVQFKLLQPKPPESVCSLPCERGQAKKYVEGESCCWHCFNCSTYQIRHPIDETQCLTCKLGTLPDANKRYCQTIPEVYLRPESAWAIGAMAFSSTGILVTLFVVGVFVRHNDTPIVRASGRELSYILLAGILMCYAVTFALVLKPTNIVCAIQRFSVGFCFTVVYAALLTKTNRIARIFKAGKQSAKRPSFISPKSQLVICSFFIFVQILINGVWMVIAPSHAMYHHPTREDNLLVCDSYIDASYMIAFFYPIFLIVVCTVYAVLTRKIPEAFNESKHIGFTMYTTCVIWLAFVPLYFGTANHVPLRITSMSVTISLSASVTIACLFSPKLYIILIRPERNVRQSMMPPRYANMHRTAGTGPSSMMAAAVVTAATCAQEEKIQKHITPTDTEHSVNNSKSKKLCEMATQTIAITNIFTNLDSSTYNQIPYADQYVPNNNQQQQHQQQQHIGHNVANNNKINQEQHGSNNGSGTGSNVGTNNSIKIHNVSTSPLSNHVIMLQQCTSNNEQCTSTSDNKPPVLTTNL